jgi:CheY-like chemotaxis protein
VSIQVLVIEDHADNLSTLLMLLESDDLHVLGVNDCQMGLALLARHRPPIVLLDLNISGETTPADFVAKAMAFNPELKIILVSGSPMIAEVASALPVAGYIAKPYDIDELLKRVRAYIPTAFQPTK